MPALRLFGRNWSLASDDIPLLAAPAAVFHCLWCIFMLVGVGLLAHHYPTNCPAGGIPLLLPSFVVPTHASQQAGGASDGLWSSCLDEHQVGMPGMRSICQLAIVAGSQPVAAIPNFLLQHPMQPQPLCSLGTVALSETSLLAPCRDKVHGVPLRSGALLSGIHHPGGLADQGGPERWAQSHSTCAACLSCPV